MNIFLSILQVLLALHTAAGAVWKFSNSEQSVASLQAIPHEVWLGLSVPEFVCTVCLLVPLFNKRLAVLAPVAALCIAAEMLFFSVVHLCSHGAEQSQLIYWLVVAAICVFLATGRLKTLSTRSGDVRGEHQAPLGV
ncbi:MAG TPA: DoxX family protein [Chroococcales cyanobacterium]